MQTMMVQLPQTSTAPAAGKTSASKGCGLFESLLGGQAQETDPNSLGDSGNELLAAAAMNPWLPSLSLDGATPAEALVVTPSSPAANLQTALLTLLASQPGVDPGPAPESNPQAMQTEGQPGGLIQVPSLTPAAVTGTDPAMSAETEAATSTLSPALTLSPLASPQSGGPQAAEKPSPVLQPAGPPAAAVTSLLPPGDAVVKLAAGPAEAVSALNPGAEVPRGQKGLAETAPLVAEVLPVDPDSEEAPLEGSSKAAGLAESRLFQLLQSPSQPRHPSAATRTGAPRTESIETLKESPVAGKPAASALQFGLEAATAEQADAVLPPIATPSSAVAAAGTGPTPAAANSPPVTAALTLPSGQVVAESQVFGQVLAGLRVGASRNSSSISLKLNPEELGEVKLEMVVEKDRVRAMIQAQSQQVQEVLERHLPRLREAFQQQGLKLEEVQVHVDSRQQENPRGFFQDQRQGSSPSRFGAGRGRFGISSEVPTIAQAVAGPAASGLSIRI